MPLVAPQIVRCAFNGTYLGRPCVNTLDMFAGDGNDVSNPRQTNIDTMLETLFNAWTDHMRGGFSTGYAVNSLTWVDLDTADGATGIKTSSDSHTWPVNGGQGGEAYSSSVALLMTKIGTSARGQRNGRWYLPALTESVVSGNTVDSDHIDDMNGLGSAFVEATTETGDLATTWYYPVLVHTHTNKGTTPPTIEFVGTSQIHSFVAQSQVASMRRRNRP